MHAERLRLRNYLRLAVWLGVFAVYVATLCPTIYLIDAGELTTVARTLGIAHPTGYPLYTLLARLATLLPIGDVAFRTNLLSALLGSGAAFLFFLLVHQLLKDLLLALVPTSIFAFSHTLWNTSLSAEVYPLTAVFICLVLLLARSMRRSSDLVLLAFIAGLSLTNHMIITTVLLPVAVYVFCCHRAGRFPWPAALAFFLIGLSIYLYLPIRAHQGPLLNWGNPRDLERFLWHVTGKQYRVWMFSSPIAEVLANLKNHLFHVAREWLYVFLVLVVLGLRNLYRTDRPLLVLCGGIVLVNTLYGVNYSIPDIECYFLPTIVALGIISASGLATLKPYAKKPIVLFAALLPLVLNFTTSTMHSNYTGYDLGRNVLASLPETSLLVTDYWDIYSPTIYVREVERRYRDVWVVDKELLRRSWYFDYLRQAYPELCRQSRSEIDGYLVLLDDFEHGRLADPNAIQLRYIRMIESFLERSRPARRAFVLLFGNPIDKTQILPDRPMIPCGFAYEIADSAATPQFDYRRFAIRRPPFNADARLEYVLELYRRIATDRAVFLERMGRAAEADQVRAWLRSEYR